MATLIAGCGGGDEGLASLAPPDTPLYAEFTLQPDDDDAESIAALGEHLAGIPDPGGLIVKRLDAALAEIPLQLSFATDVEPWLGERGSLFVRSFEPTGVADGIPDFAVALELDDADAARALLEQIAATDPAAEDPRSYGDYEYFVSRTPNGIVAGIVEEVLIIGTEASFQVAVDAGDSGSLADSEEYTQRIEALPDDPLVAVYLEPAAAIEAAIAAGDVDREQARMFGPLLAGPLSSPAVLALTATAQTASLDLATAISSSEEPPSESPLLAGLPADAWLAVAAPDLGETIMRTLDRIENSGVPGDGSIEQSIRARTGLDPRSDVLAWLGDAAAFVEGSARSNLVAGVVAETDDLEGPRKLLNRVRDLAERASGRRPQGPPEGADYGFSLGRRALGGGAGVGVFDYRLVAVSGGSAAAALDPGATLGDTAAYQDAVEALGEDLAPGLFVDLPSLLAVAEQSAVADDPGLGRLAPYLARLDSLVAGTAVKDGLELSRITLTLAD